MAGPYRFLDNLNLNRVDSPGQGGGDYAETWPAGEAGTNDHPRPSLLPLNQHGVQVFRPDAFDDNMLAGEALHVDPYANEIRDSIMSTLTPQQIEVLKQQPDYLDGAEETPASRLQNATDAAIRGAVVGQWPAEEVQKFWTPDQKQTLNGLQTYMQTGQTPQEQAQAGFNSVFEDAPQ